MSDGASAVLFVSSSSLKASSIPTAMASPDLLSLLPVLKDTSNDNNKSKKQLTRCLGSKLRKLFHLKTSQTNSIYTKNHSYFSSVN